eukprot:7651400-Pyramimonas_sp.AAC.1
MGVELQWGQCQWRQRGSVESRGDGYWLHTGQTNNNGSLETRAPRLVGTTMGQQTALLPQCDVDELHQGGMNVGLTRMTYCMKVRIELRPIKIQPSLRSQQSPLARLTRGTWEVTLTTCT